MCNPFGSIWVERGSDFWLAVGEGKRCNVVKRVLTRTYALTKMCTPRDYSVVQQQVPKTGHDAHVTAAYKAYLFILTVGVRA